MVALSTDTRDKAEETADQLELGFPVAYGLSLPGDAQKIGAFWEETRGFFHSTNFILDPEGKVTDALYSTGPLGRIVPREVLGRVRALKART